MKYELLTSLKFASAKMKTALMKILYIAMHLKTPELLVTLNCLLVDKYRRANYFQGYKISRILKISL